DRPVVSETAQTQIEQRPGRDAGGERGKRKAAQASSSEPVPCHEEKGETGMGGADGDEVRQGTVDRAGRHPRVVGEQAVGGKTVAADEEPDDDEDNDNREVERDSLSARTPATRPGSPGRRLSRFRDRYGLLCHRASPLRVSRRCWRVARQGSACRVKVEGVF